MIQIVRAILYYSTQSAFGNHHFAHLADNTKTHAMFWLAFIGSGIWSFSIFNSIDIPHMVLMVSILIFLSGLMNAVALTGPQKISILSTLTGTFIYWDLIYLIVLHVFEQSFACTLIILCFESIWGLGALSCNHARFNRLPADIRANGYTPGRC